MPENQAILREAAKKVIFFVARPHEGGWVRVGPLRKKNLFLGSKKKSEKKCGH